MYAPQIHDEQTAVELKRLARVQSISEPLSILFLIVSVVAFWFVATEPQTPSLYDFPHMIPMFPSAQRLCASGLPSANFVARETKPCDARKASTSRTSRSVATPLRETLNQRVRGSSPRRRTK